MKVPELGIAELKAFVQQIVEEKLFEILGDPDSGLELKEDVKERLKRALRARRKAGLTIPAPAPAKKLGLRW